VKRGSWIWDSGKKILRKAVESYEKAVEYKSLA